MRNDLSAQITEFRKRVPDEMNERFDPGNWVAAYQIVGGVSGYTVRELRSKLDLIGDNSAVLPVQDGNAKPRENVEKGYVEFKVNHERDYAYWQVSPEGTAFVIHQFPDNQPLLGVPLDEVVICKTAKELLNHAGKLANELGCPEATIQSRIEWNGLKLKRLRLRDHNSSDPTHLNSAAGETTATVTDLREKIAVHVHALTIELYHAFGKRYEAEDIQTLLTR